MRRRDVSPEELARIIRLRQGDTSWLQIQRDTGVSRRIAKRAYEEWGRSQAREELKTARKEVAAEEFRTHLNLMTEIEEGIVLTVCIQSTATDNRKAKDVLGMLWQIDRLHGADIIPAIDPEKRMRRVYHQNQMLFESLQAHTYGKVRWQALDEWEQAWDMCREALIKLGEEANELLNILKPTLTDRMVERSRNKDPLKLMIEGVLHVVWKDGILTKPDQGFPVVEALQRGDVFTDVTFGKHRLNLGLTFTEADLAEEVAKACKRLVENLCKGETALAVAEQVNVMEERIRELEEMLDPLRLRPLILSTQCKLCPA